MSTINNNIKISVPGIGCVSCTAYEELANTQKLFEEGEEFFVEKVNPYFVIALYVYYKAKGNAALAALLKKEAMKVNWTFNDADLIIEGRKENTPFEVLVRDTRNYPDFTNVVEHHYDAFKGWEVIRDLCVPVVKDFQ